MSTNNDTKSILKDNKVLLIVGGSGLGKTALVKLIAKEYSNNIQEVDVCSVGFGRQYAVMELSKLMVDETSDKVFILDEFHLITKAGQRILAEALTKLKANTRVIMVTTNKGLIEADIIDNAETIEVLEPTTTKVFELLVNICNQEDLEYESRALSHIAENCKNIREAIMLLEQLIETGSDITTNNVSELFE